MLLFYEEQVKRPKSHRHTRKLNCPFSLLFPFSPFPPHSKINEAVRIYAEYLALARKWSLAAALSVPLSLVDDLASLRHYWTTICR